MSKLYTPGGIGDKDRRVFRLFKILHCVGRYVLHFVFKSGCKKEPTETIEKYLKEKKHMEHKDYKNRFDTTMRKAIDNDPSGEFYDVSLLYACIRWGCDPPTEANEWLEGKESLESLCTKLKNMRNRICHGEEICNDDVMNQWCDDITEVFKKIIKLAGVKYKIPHDVVPSILMEINKQISDIRKAPLGEADHDYLILFKEKQKEDIREIGKKELQERYRDTSKIDPASFVTGKERLHVKNVFTTLEVICENMDETYKVGYNELFEVKTEDDKELAVIIIEGDAGAGKTTLTKLILSDWAEGSTIFQGLDQYDLVFRAEGKRCISSYSELIQGLLPTTSYKFHDDDLLRSVCQLKVLLIMDGFDELNKESEKLIKELSDKHVPGSNGRLQLLVTTRPSKLSDLCVSLSTHRNVRTKLKGISLDKRVEFVTKLHSEMINEKLSKQNTEKLVDLLKQSQARLGEHYRLPLNLTLLTHLWASDPSRVNPETTATGLYIAFLELNGSRLQARLQEQLGTVALPKDKSQEVVRKFQEVLYSVCLDTLLSDSMQLSNESEKALKHKCEALGVPVHDMIEAFLVVEKEWTSSGYKTELIVPHKSVLEFYAANQFMAYIKARNDGPIEKELISSLMKLGKQEDEIRKFLNRPKEEDVKPLKTICNDLLKTDQDLAKYENMFLHLTGLLADQCHDILHKYSEELVQILQDAAFKGTKWLDLLVEAKCDDSLTSLLAPLTDLQLIIRDGHMGAALALFKHLETNTPVQVVLENEVTYIPRLEETLCQLSVRDCAVEIFFKHQWKNPKYGFSDEHLSKLLPGGLKDQRCRVTKFTGLLKTLSCLPKSLTDLKIAFDTTEHAKQLLVELKDLVKHNAISYIGIHVMPGVMPDGLSPLPILKSLKGGGCGTLWLSKVDEDWQTKCRVIRALLPDGGVFNSIMFPQSNFTANQCRQILAYLKDLNVKVGSKGGIRFSSSTVNKAKLSELKMSARQYLDCALYCTDDSIMW